MADSVATATLGGSQERLVHSHKMTHPKSHSEDLLHQALDTLRAVRANYKAWRELWPHEQAAVCSAGESLEAELKRRSS